MCNVSELFGLILVLLGPPGPYRPIFGPILDSFWAILVHFWSRFGPFWALLGHAGPFGAHFGSLLAPFWAILAHFGIFWAIWAPHRGCLRALGGPLCHFGGCFAVDAGLLEAILSLREPLQFKSRVFYAIGAGGCLTHPPAPPLQAPPAVANPIAASGSTRGARDRAPQRTDTQT